MFAEYRNVCVYGTKITPLLEMFARHTDMWV